FGHDHELLKIDRRVGVRAAVDDVHHRDGKHLRIWPAEVSEKRKAKLVRRSPRGCERDSQDRVRAELAFVRRAIERNHCLVQADLIESVHAGHLFRDNFFHIRDGFGDATREEALFLAVAQFPRLVFSGARAARHDGAAGRTAGERHYGFDSWITAGIDDLAAVDSDNLRHGHNRCSSLSTDMDFYGVAIRFVTSVYRGSRWRISNGTPSHSAAVARSRKART